MDVIVLYIVLAIVAAGCIVTFCGLTFFWKMRLQKKGTKRPNGGAAGSNIRNPDIEENRYENNVHRERLRTLSVAGAQTVRKQSTAAISIGTSRLNDSSGSSTNSLDKVDNADKLESIPISFTNHEPPTATKRVILKVPGKYSLDSKYASTSAISDTSSSHGSANSPPSSFDKVPPPFPDPSVFLPQPFPALASADSPGAEEWESASSVSDYPDRAHMQPTDFIPIETAPAHASTYDVIKPSASRPISPSYTEQETNPLKRLKDPNDDHNPPAWLQTVTGKLKKAAKVEVPPPPEPEFKSVCLKPAAKIEPLPPIKPLWQDIKLKPKSPETSPTLHSNLRPMSPLLHGSNMGSLAKSPTSPSTPNNCKSRVAGKSAPNSQPTSPPSQNVGIKVSSASYSPLTSPHQLQLHQLQLHAQLVSQDKVAELSYSNYS